MCVDFSPDEWIMSRAEQRELEKAMGCWTVWRDFIALNLMRIVPWLPFAFLPVIKRHDWLMELVLFTFSLQIILGLAMGLAIPALIMNLFLKRTVLRCPRCFSKLRLWIPPLEWQMQASCRRCWFTFRH